jgi:hypothetical protein
VEREQDHHWRTEDAQDIAQQLAARMAALKAQLRAIQDQVGVCVKHEAV